MSRAEEVLAYGHEAPGQSFAGPWSLRLRAQLCELVTARFLSDGLRWLWHG